MTRIQQMNRRALLVGACALSSAAWPGAALARKSAASALAPDDAEMEDGAVEEWAGWKRAVPVSTDAAATARVSAVGQKIAAVSRLRGQRWEFVAFRDPEIFAFSCYGGRIGVFTGLLDFIENDDQLAFAIGHEVGHLAGGHHAALFGQVFAAQLGLNVAGAAHLGEGATVGPIPAQQVLAVGAEVGAIYPYARAQESEADRIGVDLMRKAGYQPLQAVRYFERLSGEPAPQVDALFAEHPQNIDRMADLLNYIQRKRYDRM